MKYILITLAIFCTLIVYSQNKDAITTDIFLDKEILKDLSIDAKFINSFEYTPDGFILLSSANRFYILGVGGLIPIWGNWNSESGIESFTITSDSLLVLVSGDALFFLDSVNSFTKFQVIPENNMGISSKYDNIYLYDKILKNDKKDYSIYQMSNDNNIKRFITIQTPILSMFECPSQLIFSTKNMVFSLDIKTKKLFLLFSLPYESDIISIVGDTDNQTFYFSTENNLYRVKNNQIELLCENFNGILKYDSKGLIVFNPKENLIVRFRNNVLNANNLYKKQIVVQQNDKKFPFEPEMIFVDGGTFTMGCTREQGIACCKDEQPAHRVTLNSFYIAKYEVTQEQWIKVMGKNPSSISKDCYNCPVNNISWNDAQEFINNLNQLTGKNYRLPTEAEWEYAARGGNQSKGYRWSGSDYKEEVAWNNWNAGNEEIDPEILSDFLRGSLNPTCRIFP